MHVCDSEVYVVIVCSSCSGEQRGNLERRHLCVRCENGRRKPDTSLLWVQELGRLRLSLSPSSLIQWESSPVVWRQEEWTRRHPVKVFKIQAGKLGVKTKILLEYIYLKNIYKDSFQKISSGALQDILTDRLLKGPAVHRARNTVIPQREY